MIQLDDYDHTFIPESEEDCQKLACAESQNINYDIGSRTKEQAAEHRRKGKLEEARVCMWLAKAGFSVQHGIRTGKKYADNGADIQLGEKHRNVKLQIKSCSYDSILLFDRSFSSKEEQLKKLQQFDGAVLIVNEDKNTGIRTCWLGNGKNAFQYAVCKEDCSFIKIPYRECFKQLSMKNGDFEKEAFEKLLMEQIN